MADRIRIIPYEAVPCAAVSRSAFLTVGRLDFSILG